MAKLYYFRGARPNFGDELNSWLWPRLLPGFLDDASDELFLGIGAILNSSVPMAPRRIVFGSGYGYGEPPKLEPGKWRIHCVLGPRTAQALGLPDTLAVGDPAFLLRRMPLPRPTKQYLVSYMPHWESIDRGHWPLACAQADVHFIDPTAPVEQVVADLLASELVIAEGMRGHSAPRMIHKSPTTPTLLTHGHGRCTCWNRSWNDLPALSSVPCPTLSAAAWMPRSFALRRATCVESAGCAPA